MKAVITYDEFRKNLSSIVGKVMDNNQTILVQKPSKSGVIVISEREYENLRDPRKRFASKEEWDNLFLVSDKIREGMTLQDQEQLDDLLPIEIKKVRLQKNKK